MRGISPAQRAKHLVRQEEVGPWQSYQPRRRWPAATPCQLLSMLAPNWATTVYVWASSMTERGWTALHLSASRGFKAVVQLLLEKGADIDAKDGNGWTALYSAASYGNEAMARLLLRKGADTEAKDVYGGTALERAVQLGRVAMVSLLLDRGTNPWNVDIEKIEKSSDRMDQTDFEVAVRKIQESKRMTNVKVEVQRIQD